MFFSSINDFDIRCTRDRAIARVLVMMLRVVRGLRRCAGQTSPALARAWRECPAAAVAVFVVMLVAAKLISLSLSSSSVNICRVIIIIIIIINISIQCYHSIVTISHYQHKSPSVLIITINHHQSSSLSSSPSPPT